LRGALRGKKASPVRVHRRGKGGQFSEESLQQARKAFNPRKKKKKKGENREEAPSVSKTGEVLGKTFSNEKGRQLFTKNSPERLRCRRRFKSREKKEKKGLLLPRGWESLFREKKKKKK